MGISRGNWKVGLKGHTVTTNDGFGFKEDTGHSEINWYGGYLIAESIFKPEDAQLISASPDLLDAGKQILNGFQNFDKAEFYNGLASMVKAIEKAEPKQKLLENK